jgi:hypothetical protein
MKRTGLSQAAEQGSSYIHFAPQWINLLEEAFMYPNVHTATVDSLPDVGHELPSCLLKDAARVRTEGRGKTQPIGDNASKEGRARNRRVEVRLTQSDSQAGKN